MKETSRAWFAVANPDGTYGEPQLFDGVVEFADDWPDDHAYEFPTGGSGTIEFDATFDRAALARLLGIPRVLFLLVLPTIWQARARETKRRLRRV